MPDVSHFIHDKAEQKKRIEEKRQMILEFLAAETFSTSEIISSLLNVSRIAAYKTLKSMEKKELVPKCSCGGIIKPGVVLYEESLNQKTLEQSVRYISQADMLIVGGTSLTVYPAAGLIDYYRGNKLVLINMAATVRDGMADLIIKRKIGEALSEAVE